MITKGMLCTYRVVKKGSISSGGLYKVISEPNGGKATVSRLGTPQKFAADLERLRPFWVQLSDLVNVSGNAAARVSGVDAATATCSNNNRFYVSDPHDVALVVFVDTVARRGTRAY